MLLGTAALAAACLWAAASLRGPAEVRPRAVARRPLPPSLEKAPQAVSPEDLSHYNYFEMMASEGMSRAASLPRPPHAPAPRAGAALPK